MLKDQTNEFAVCLLEIRIWEWSGTNDPVKTFDAEHHDIIVIDDKRWRNDKRLLENDGAFYALGWKSYMSRDWLGVPMLAVVHVTPFRSTKEEERFWYVPN